MISGIFTMIYNVWIIITLSLKFDPNLLAIIEQYREANIYVLVVAILGGASQLLGQSAILFINHVKPARFIFSLFFNGIIYMLSLLVWATCIWAIGYYGFGYPQTWGAIGRLVALGSAPYVFGFLVLIPYAGPGIGRVLSVWSFLIVLNAVIFSYKAGLWQGLVVVGLGWLLVYLMTITIGRPIIAVRNRLWNKIVGTPLDATAQDILKSIAVDNQARFGNSNNSSEDGGAK
jgi:hypothetical protein